MVLRSHLSLLMLLVSGLFSVAGLSSSAMAAASCGAGEQEVCGYQTENVCATRYENVCNWVNVCDPFDNTNCHTEYQCGYENVYSCQPETTYSCTCAPSREDPPSDTFCQSYGCSECGTDRRQFCGSYNSCTSTWVNGSWQSCTP